MLVVQPEQLYLRKLAAAEFRRIKDATERVRNHVSELNLFSLDSFCFQGLAFVETKTAGFSPVVCQGVISDITLCLGQILLQDFKGYWAQGFHCSLETQNVPRWFLILSGEHPHIALDLHRFVGARFFNGTEITFTDLFNLIMRKRVHELDRLF